MMGSIPSRLLHEWMAFYQIEPFGEWRKDLRAGIIASVFANVHRDPKRSPHSPLDFMPKFETSKKKKPSAVDLKSKILAIATALGAKVIKRGEQ